MDVSKQIREKFEEMKGSDRHIYLIRNSGRFYVYRIIYGSDREGKRKKLKSEYIGRFTEEGAYIKKGASKEEKQLELAKAIISRYGGTVSLPRRLIDEESADEETDGRSLIPSEEEEKALTILSMNGRARVSSIARLIKRSPQSTVRLVKKLEDKYDIRYTSEVDVNKLGYLEFLIFIKFKDEVPPANRIKEVFEKEPAVQFCATLKGDYDVLLYVLFEAFEADYFTKADIDLYNMRLRAFPDSMATWYVKTVHTVYGLVPIRDQFFDVLKGRVWHRTVHTPRPRLGEILQREYTTLKALNSNANINFQDMDKENGLPNGTSRYSYYRLLQQGTLHRVTISMGRTPILYTAIVYMNRQLPASFAKTRNNFRRNVIADNAKTKANRYTAILDVDDPDGVFLFVPVYRDETLEDKIDALRSEVEGVTFTTQAIMTSILVGNLCHRRFDNAYAVQYENLVKANELPHKERVSYDKL